VIRPPWETAAVDPDIACLTLEPGLAFGTGTHPTTSVCLKLLTEHLQAVQGTRVLDVGCGSGILSLAALKLGARAAVGVDIDNQAVMVAQHNAALNDLQHCVRFAHGSWEITEGVFDIIVANIYLGPLLQMIPPLARRLAPHGFLLVSGILETQEEAVVQALGTAALRLRQRAAEEGWVTLMAEHAEAEKAG
jgi:ribosomal protein L11 methyltransferase